MSYAITREDLIVRRYKPSGCEDTCRYCGEPVEWWKNYRNKGVLFNLMPDIRSKAIPHLGVCKKRPQ